MAAGDIYKASEEQTSASQREALAALARGGTAELQAFQAAQQQQSADKGDVLRQILDRATSLGAGAAGQELAAKVSPSLDLRSQALASMHSSNESAMGQIGAANSNYFDQVNAAVPLVKARSDEINEANRIKAEQEAAQRDLERQLAEMRLMGEYASLENTQAAGRNAAAKASGGGGDLSDSELKTRLLGAASAKKAATPNLEVFGVKLPQLSQTAQARKIGVEAGLDPARVFGVTLPKAVTPPRPSQQLADQRAQAEMAAVQARLNLIETAKRAASKGTFFELEKAIDRGEAEQSMQAAIDYVNGLDAGYLKRNSISRPALLDWVKRYGAI